MNVEAGIEEAAAAASAETTAGQNAGRGLRVSDIVDLFARPRVFFSGEIFLGDPRILIPVAWILGISAQIDRIDTQIVRQGFQEAPPLWRIIEPIVTGPWIYYWGWCAGFGALTAVLVYFIGGWWYRIRLGLSGGTAHDVRMPRYVYAYASVVGALPQILVTLWLTANFPNYRAAFAADEGTGAVVLFYLWSIVVSYGGATTAFDLVRWKARLWFLILPMLFFFFVLSGIVGFAMLLS